MNSPLLTAPVSRHSCYTKFHAFHSTFHVTIVPLSPFQPVVNTPQLLDCSLFNGTHQRTACYVSFKSHFLTAEAMAALSAAHARASLGLPLRFPSAFMFQIVRSSLITLFFLQVLQSMALCVFPNGIRERPVRDLATLSSLSISFYAVTTRAASGHSSLALAPLPVLMSVEADLKCRLGPPIFWRSCRACSRF
jgi:hypothetical protein